MKVILLQNIKGFGQIGDIKNVHDGYGRNFLIPKNLARVADANSVKLSEALKQKAHIVLKEEREKAKIIAERLKDAVIEISRKASKTGTLFASVTKKDIIKELDQKFAVKLGESAINLKEHDEHIKHVGEHLIDLELAPDIKTELKIIIKEE